MLSYLSDETLRDILTSRVYSRGLGYYREGRVRDLTHDPVHDIWEAKVRGTSTYHVIIEEGEDDFSSECTCPAYERNWEPCKHIAAVLMKISERAGKRASLFEPLKANQAAIESRGSFQENYEKRMREIEKERIAREKAHLRHLTHQFIQTFSSFSQDDEANHSEINKASLMTEWIIKINSPYFVNKQFLTIEMKTGLHRTYVVKKIREFLKAIKFHTQYPFTKKFTYDPTEQEFSEVDREIINLLLEALKYEEIFEEMQPSYYRGQSSMDERAMMISPMIADRLFAKLAERNIYFQIDRREYRQIEFHESELPLAIQLEKGEGDDFQLDLKNLAHFHYLDLYGYIIRDNRLYKASPNQQVLVRELITLLNGAKNQVLPIDKDQIEPFISQVAPQLEKISKLEISEKVSSKIVKFPLEAKVFVDWKDDLLQVSLQFHYGENKINPFGPGEQRKDGPIIMRDADKEKYIMDIIESASLRFNGKMLYAAGEQEVFEFLYEILPQLEDEAEVLVTNAVKSLVMPVDYGPVTNIDMDSSGNWLEVSFDMSGIEQEEIQNMLQSVVEKKKYYRLASGAFVSLQSEEFETIQNMFRQLGIKPQELRQEKLQLPIYRGIQLNEIAGREKGSQTRYGKSFRRLINSMKNPEELEFDIPHTLQAELRDYQSYGFQWLKTLGKYRLGGILADDMGLGKTLQTIAYLLSEKGEMQNAEPALVVAPASLVYNWKNEIQRFAPTLTAEVIIGTPQEREEKLKESVTPDVWITSYPTLRQDIDSYKRREFSALILDEAQAIKNHVTKTAKAVREIKARTRFALSGTPIENSIDELWSIFQTIMPDFFPNLKTFRQLEPEKVGNMIKPFLLRRVKRDVLKELPDKIETVNYSDLTKPQKELYLAYLERIKQETRESLQGEGFQRSRIKILAGLTRLRQLCCHPSLFLENYQGESGKLQQLMEFVHTARENGRRMLIFSQFTGMLAIIREKLESAGLSYFYLDGGTPPKERVEMVDRFNQGEKDIFLVSLKAGNTGLNLTGADTVILYDLWWNPAVEEQAAGRAHRIGQKKVVQVIRLITQGTIEEKIYELQQNKKELIDTVIQPGDQALSKITEEDIREILSI